MSLVQAVESEAQLEDILSEPTPQVVETISRLRGDIMLLGVAGKMGPSLARMVVRASIFGSVKRRVVGVARFSGGGEEALREQGVETIRCDLLDPEQLARLPDAENIIYMVGRKFGSTGAEATTWVVNACLPGLVCRRFRGGRLVAFSTGNVYPLAPVDGPGAREGDPVGAIGEYAQSCLGRERVLEFHSRQFDMPMAIIRLNYACDLRYGVLVDLASKVWAGEAIDLTMGFFNTIWQGDANAMTLRAFDHLAAPPRTFNVTGLQRQSVREVCEQFARLMNRPVRFTGVEAPTALLSDAALAQATIGPARVSESQLIEWVADWVRRGGRRLGKPTHFEARDGQF